MTRIARTFRIPVEVDEVLRLAAEAAGESLTEFVSRAVLERADYATNSGALTEHGTFADQIDRAWTTVNRTEPRFRTVEPPVVRCYDPLGRPLADRSRGRDFDLSDTDEDKGEDK